MQLKGKALTGLSILMLGFLAGCGGSEGGPNVGAEAPSYKAPLTNSYFEAFVAEYAAPPEALPVGDGILRIGDVGLTDSNELVHVDNILLDGRVLVSSLRHRANQRTENHVTPKRDGTNGLYKGHYALTVLKEVVYVNRVFADGRAEVTPVTGTQGSRIEAILMPQRIGNFRVWAVTSSNEVVHIEKVFADGHAEVTPRNNTGPRIESNLVPVKNGVNGLFIGQLAITQSNERVLLENVFADGRAEVSSGGYRGANLRIESSLTPAVAR